MSEGKYLDTIELKLKLHFPKAHKFNKKMKNLIKRAQSELVSSAERENFGPKVKKFIEIEENVLVRLLEGKCVQGSLRVDEFTNEVVFRAYNRLSRQPGYRDRLIAQLEHGWIKESKQCYKFYNSVRKDIGVTKVSVVMGRELDTAMSEVRVDRLLDIL